MKTARRQELRTNELSQQLDSITDYVKHNTATLAIIVAAAAILTAGGFWFVKNRQNRIMDGWAMLNDSEVLKDIPSAVGNFRTLAEENRSTGLSLAAWMRIGEIAMAQLGMPDASSVSSGQNWTETAATAYNRILNDYPNDITAVGQSLIALGVLAENKSDMEKARHYYQKVLDDPRFTDMPFKLQAKFRIDGLSRWSQPVVFPPAPVTVPAPDPLLMPTTAPSLPILPTSQPAGASTGGVQIVPALQMSPIPPATQPKG